MKTTTNKEHIKNAPDFDVKLPVEFEGKTAEIVITDLNIQGYPIGAIIDNEELEQFTSKGFYFGDERESGRLKNLWPEPIEGYEMEACGWGGLEGDDHDGYIVIRDDHSCERYDENYRPFGDNDTYYIKLTNIKEELSQSDKVLDSILRSIFCDYDNDHPQKVIGALGNSSSNWSTQIYEFTGGYELSADYEDWSLERLVDHIEGLHTSIMETLD